MYFPILYIIIGNERLLWHFCSRFVISTREFLEGCIKSCSSEDHVFSPTILCRPRPPPTPRGFILPPNSLHENYSTPELCLYYSQDHSMKILG